MMTAITIVGIVGGGVFLFILLPIMLVYMLESEYNPIEDFREHRKNSQIKRERHLPVWERLVLAEERAGEEQLREGRSDLARKHFREAQKIRDEANEALAKGELPKL